LKRKWNYPVVKAVGMRCDSVKDSKTVIIFLGELYAGKKNSCDGCQTGAGWP
jgi:hypothetical protein